MDDTLRAAWGPSFFATIRISTVKLQSSLSLMPKINVE